MVFSEVLLRSCPPRVPTRLHPGLPAFATPGDIEQATFEPVQFLSYYIHIMFVEWNMPEAFMPLDRRPLLSVAAVLAILLLADPPVAAQLAGNSYHGLIRPVVQWTFQTGGTFTAPAIGGDGTIYVGSYDGYLYALNPDGTVKWRFEIGRRIDIYTSPALGNGGTIYVSVDGDLYAIGPGGTLKWTYETSGDVDVSPAIGTGGTIYVGTDDGILYALGPEGSLKWTYSVVGSIRCTPAFGADGTIYVEGGVKGESGSNLYAISAGGTLKWRYPLEMASKARPAIGPGGTIYVGAMDGYLYALRPDGSLQWKSRSDDHYERMPPSIGPDGTIYVNPGQLNAFYPDGTLKWAYDPDKLSLFTSPPVVGPGGIVYITADSSGSNNYSYLYAIDPGGHLRWKLRFEGRSWRLSAPVLGPDGRLYIGESKYLHAIGSATVSAGPQGVMISDKYHLYANYPNPFNPATTISYSLPMAGPVTLQVFDLFGRRVRVLVDRRQTAGRHEVGFDGSSLPSGVYIYRLQAGTYTETRRMMLVK